MGLGDLFGGFTVFWDAVDGDFDGTGACVDGEDGFGHFEDGQLALQNGELTGVVMYVNLKIVWEVR